MRENTKVGTRVAKIKKGKIFVISGPSGSGKTTLLSRLLAERGIGNKLVKSISFTTRPKRSKEKEKKDYFFVSEAEFKRLRKAKKILEWTRYLGYYYATPRDFVLHHLGLGKSILLCLDFAGAKAVKRMYPRSTVTIFVKPPSITELRERISGRCARTKQEEIMRRLKMAESELLQCREYDYCILNKALNVATQRLKKIILKETAV